MGENIPYGILSVMNSNQNVSILNHKWAVINGSENTNILREMKEENKEETYII